MNIHDTFFLIITICALYAIYYTFKFYLFLCISYYIFYIILNVNAIKLEKYYLRMSCNPTILSSWSRNIGWLPSLILKSSIKYYWTISCLVWIYMWLLPTTWDETKLFPRIISTEHCVQQNATLFKIILHVFCVQELFNFKK